MIRPILEYGDVIYDNGTISTVQTLDQLQRQAALICTGGYRHSDYTKLLKELNWEPLRDRRKIHKLILFYKIKRKIYPNYLSKYIVTTNENTYNLRTTNELTPRYSRLNNSFKSFFPSSTRLWNNLPQATRNATTVNLFKILIRGTNNYNPYHSLCSGKLGSWLTRLRLGLSALNSHRFKFNFIDSPTCSSCHHNEETTYHYLFTCQSHIEARRNMFNRLNDELGVDTQDQEILLNIILEGETINIRNLNALLSIIYEYMKQTKRFI